MRRSPKSLSFAGLTPRSKNASNLARTSSKKRNTKCELALRKALRAHGLKFQVCVRHLVGCPDIVFSSHKLIVFVDGDFWHGRHLRSRVRKLSAGHNSSYWVSKIKNNVKRDRQVRAALERDGWSVLRVWEGDIGRDKERVVAAIRKHLNQAKARSMKNIKHD